MKISIIIPVYNAEKYLKKCLDSVVNQTLDLNEIEVLLINDGSTDGCLEIAETYQNLIPNYRILTQKNGGEAAARNAALGSARGEYITFLDNDDYYEKNTLQNALEVISKGNLDILYLRIQQVDEEGNFICFAFDMQDEEVATGLNFERRPFPATVYRREIIGNAVYPKNILVGTDSVFNALVQSHAARVSFTKNSIYNYTYRADSLSKKGNTENGFLGFLNAIKTLIEYRKKHFAEDDRDAKNYFDRIISVFVTRIIELSIIPEWNAERYKILTSLLSKEKLLYILDDFAAKYPYINRSFYMFKSWQQYLGFKSKIYKLIHRA